MTQDSAQDGDADFDTAVGDPSAYYADPQAILADETLGRDQKLRFLREWAQDLADRQTADGEGMAPESVRAIETDAALVRQVKAALAQAEEQPIDTGPEWPVRSLWKRLTGQGK